MKSIFTDKDQTPTEDHLKSALGNTYPIWKQFQQFTKEHYPAANEEWNFSGEKFGWSFRIKDKKRVIIYLLPRDQFFKTAFVFGQKAMDKILESELPAFIKEELSAAKAYAEGRGIRIEIKDKTIIPAIEKLIRIKIAY
ncbi:MAG: DUF3788 domain-containing protein [Chitinophagaceae bacterium]|jgi:hypothetical protein